jgi:hypothetical protein
MPIIEIPPFEKFIGALEGSVGNHLNFFGGEVFGLSITSAPHIRKAHDVIFGPAFGKPVKDVVSVCAARGNAAE